MEPQMELALQELNGSGQEAQEPQAQAETAQELLEIMAGEQAFKIPLNAEAAIKHNGQIQKTPIEKIINAYRQAAHVEDKFKELRNQRSMFEQERGDLEQFKTLKQKYGAIQDWSEQNPQEWEALWDLYQNRSNVLRGQTGEGQTINPEVMQLREELAELKKFKSEFERQQEELRAQADVQEIEQEIEAFKKEYPHINLEEKDLDGVSLQALIIKHGLEKGYPDFRSSALTYPGLMERVLDTVQRQSRTEAVKTIKKDNAQGVIARSSTPFGQGAKVDPRRLSENERDDAARQELAQLLGQM